MVALLIPLGFLLFMGGGSLWAAHHEGRARRAVEAAERRQLQSAHDKLGRL